MQYTVGATGPGRELVQASVRPLLTAEGYSAFFAWVSGPRMVSEKLVHKSLLPPQPEAE